MTVLRAAPVTRPFALVRTGDQWLRCAHADTALDVEAGVVTLAQAAASFREGAGNPKLAAGLAFDSECRLFRSRPEEGQVERWMWAAIDDLHPGEEPPKPLAVLGSNVPPEPLGDFTAPGASQPLAFPLGLAVDSGDRLWVAEAGANRVLVFDLWSRRLLRSITCEVTDPAGHARPLDLAVLNGTVYAITEAPAGLWRLDLCSQPERVPLPEGVEPQRIAVCPLGRMFVLDHARTAQARVVPLDRPGEAFVVNDRQPAIGAATDIEFEADCTLVVAGLPGGDFARFRWTRGTVGMLQPLRARGYDGRGIARTPDGRIVYWTADGGLAHAVPARMRYARSGRVITFRLDSGAFQTVWGRLFVDACVPRGTTVRAFCVAVDEPPPGASVVRTLPANIALNQPIPYDDRTPPLPPQPLVPGDDALEAVLQPLHRRETGRELPWSRPEPGQVFETYEAPVLAEAGRYLWVTLTLDGDTSTTPQLRCLRAEYPSHDYLRRLPEIYSREPESASFLRRYLAMFEGTLLELEARAAERHLLLDPCATPAELLPWLSGFVGLLVDDRWSTAVRRALLAEIDYLFRFRGTPAGLKRFLEICLGVRVILVEQFRLRGIGGALLGPPTSAVFSSAVLGGGFRVGGAIGQAGTSPIAGKVEDAFRTHAHRFAVIVPAELSSEQESIARRVLEVHRPAHTIYQLCTVCEGMRVAIGLHVGLSAVVGRSSGFRTFVVGRAGLGREALLGRPGLGPLENRSPKEPGDWSATTCRR